MTPHDIPPPEKRGRGRPTLYEERFCEEVVEFCADGFSLTAFAGKIGVGRETIAEWARVHPEFSVAVQAAKAAAAHSLEEDARRIRKDGGGTGSATLTIFGLKNFASDDFRESQEIKHSGAVGSYDLTKLNDEQLAALQTILSGAAVAGGDQRGDSEAGG